MWMFGGNPVDILSRRRNFTAEYSGSRPRAACGCSFDGPFACAAAASRAECSPSFTFHRLLENAVTVHRFEETINGREYRIEVSPVDSTTWRAQIARTHGGARALMPFYGRTPDEAAKQLSRWLALAHARSTPQV
jgi:hypothetical protein